MSRHSMQSRLRAVFVALVGAVVLQAQGFGLRDENSLVHNIPYDGRFTFARLRYTTGPGGYYYGGLPSWAHGFPRAEQNLTKILNAVSSLAPHLDATNAIAADDPEIFKYPVLFMTEGGYWTMTDKEVLLLRAYLQKGGFIIFDDFRDGFRGGGGWDNFASVWRRVLPDGQFVDLDPSHPIFHSFFEINTFSIIPQDYDRGAPILRGIFEDNDPKKRLLAMINFNTDVSNFWEFSATGQMPVSATNEAYKLGVNYVMYGITH
ncbi:MAG: DUF4159 domain-containing protein [Gemmatimonadota bacterium]|nr:DUF4159 domain-containing protein [Gemmatimonadota bacterium]